jgi:hypothetical protein
MEQRREEMPLSRRVPQSMDRGIKKINPNNRQNLNQNIQYE